MIKAGRKDIPLLQQMANTIWNDCYRNILSKDQIEYMLDWMYSDKTIAEEMDHNYQWILIKQDDTTIGFISYHYEKESNAVKLCKLYILPAFQGKGLGQASLKYVIEEATKLKADYVYLTVNKNNEKAIRSYRKANFIIDHPQVFDIGNGYQMDDYVMKRVCRGLNTKDQ
jgi:ribosomal protein S18 acetylase RimI-like enzyme